MTTLRKILGWVLTLVGACGTIPLAVLRWFPDLQLLSPYTVYAATFIPFLWAFTLALLLGLTLLVLGVARLIAVVLTVVAAAYWGIPLFGSTQPTKADAGDFQFVSINAQFGQADVRELLAEVHPSTAVLTIQEFTPAMQQKLKQVGIDRQFPHFAGEAREDASGTAIYSKYPMKTLAEHDDVFMNLVVEMTVTTDGADVPLRFAAIHAAPPTLGVEQWRRDAEAITRLLQPYAGEPLVAVGDYNAISDHATMRSLQAATKLEDPTSQQLFVDSRSQLTQWQPTWPTSQFVPPFARIDHMLVWSGGNWVQPTYFRVAGADHKGIRGGLWMHAR